MSVRVVDMRGTRNGDSKVLDLVPELYAEMKACEARFLEIVARSGVGARDAVNAVLSVLSHSTGRYLALLEHYDGRPLKDEGLSAFWC